MTMHTDTTTDTPVYATLSAGSVEYSREVAAVDIEELIEALHHAFNDGATHVVGLSGNYRGAQYVRLSTDVQVVEDDEEDEN